MGKWLHYSAIALLMLFSAVATSSWLGVWNPAFRFLPKQDGTVSKAYATCSLLEHLGADGRVHFDRECVSIGGVAGQLKAPDDSAGPTGSVKFDVWVMAYHYDAITLRTGKGPWSGAVWRVEVRYVTLAAAFALYPVIFFVRRYRHRRMRRRVLHPCGQCGYDLHGNESGKCPECGTRKEDTA